jgi:hypothetical protein
VRAQHLQKGLAGERHRSREHLVQDHAQRVDIHAKVRVLAARLLGRHVLRRPEDHARSRESPALGLTRSRLFGGAQLGDAEVHDLDDLLPVRRALHEHVFRLQIAVHDAARMGGPERATDLHGDGDAALGREGALALELVRQVVPLEVLHGQKEAAVLQAAEVEDIEHVRVLDARGADRFLLEAEDDVRLRRILRSEDLERHLLFDGFVLGQVHLTHAAFAELAQHAEAARYERVDQGIDRLGHQFAHGQA